MALAFTGPNDPAPDLIFDEEVEGDEEATDE